MKSITILNLLILLFSVNISAQDNRVLADYKLEKIQDILLSDYDIFRPNLIDINKGGSIIFFDFARYELVVYEMGSKAFQFYGNRGKGPKEFGQIFDVKVDENDDIYLVDTGNNKIVKWALQGKYIGEMSVGTRFIRPARFTLCKDSDVMYILSSQYGRDGLLHKYDKAGNLQQSFHKIEGNKERSPYFTDGTLACDEHQNLYYAKRYVNEIMKFDKNGEHVYTIPFYDTEKYKDIKIVQGKFYALNPSAPRYSSNIYYLDEKLYVSYSGLPKNFRYRFIDVYSEVSQEYLYSIQLPFEFREFVMNEKRIIILREDEKGEMYLTVFEYKYDGQETE